MGRGVDVVEVDWLCLGGNGALMSVEGEQWAAPQAGALGDVIGRRGASRSTHKQAAILCRYKTFIFPRAR